MLYLTNVWLKLKENMFLKLNNLWRFNSYELFRLFYIKKYFLFLFFLFLFLFPLEIEAQEKIKGIGFLSKNIWYSKEPFFSGDTIRIYTIINNSTNDDIIGKVLFYNDKKLIGTSNFSAVSGGYGIILWADWQAIYGKHLISAEISEAKIAQKNGIFIDISLENFKSSTDSINIDFDSDKDQIGDKEDDDDDNDGLSDKEELRLGTDPLKVDTDNDGVKDFIDSNNPKDPNVSEKNYSIQKLVQNSALNIKKPQEKIIPSIIEVPKKIDLFFENKKNEIKFKKEEIEKTSEIKKFKETKKEIFSLKKEKRDSGVAQFKQQFKEKEEKKKIIRWVFWDFLNFILEKRMIFLYFVLFLLFLFFLRRIKRRRKH